MYNVKIGDCDVDILDYYAGATGSIGNIEASPEVESNAFLSKTGTWWKKDKYFDDTLQKG